MEYADYLKRKRDATRERRTRLSMDVRQSEQIANAERMCDAHTNVEVRENEQRTDTESRLDARTNTDTREREATSNTNKMRVVRTRLWEEHNEQSRSKFHRFYYCANR